MYMYCRSPQECHLTEVGGAFNFGLGIRPAHPLASLETTMAVEDLCKTLQPWHAAMFIMSIQMLYQLGP